MPTDFLHGVEVIEIQEGIRPIRTVRSAVIGLVGSAPKGPINVPTLIVGSPREGVLQFGADVGTIPDALDAIFGQHGAVVVVVNVLDPATDKRAVVAQEYDLTGDTVQLADRYVAGVVAMTNTVGTPLVFDVGLVEGTDYTVDSTTGVLTRVEGGGLAANGKAEIGYDVPDDTLVTAADIEGGVDAATGAYTGVDALLGAQSALGFTPRILIAPGYSDQKTVADALISVGNRLRATCPIEGPSTTDAAAQTYRGDFGSRRAYLVDPDVQVADADGLPVAAPNSAYVAGVIAQSDAERGFWWSPSNRVILGILGTDRPIDFALGDANARANLLNENEVATIIREDGYRLWGNRTCSDDPKWAFLSVVRTADILNDSLLRAHLWAVDRNISRTYFEDVANGVNAYIAQLVGQGALLGGLCFPTPDLNTKESLADGRVYFDIDFTPPPPAERVTFRSRLTNDYLEEVLT